jgi:hypothetical protein
MTVLSFAIVGLLGMETIAHGNCPWKFDEVREFSRNSGKTINECEYKRICTIYENVLEKANSGLSQYEHSARDDIPYSIQFLIEEALRLGLDISPHLSNFMWAAVNYGSYSRWVLNKFKKVLLPFKNHPTLIKNKIKLWEIREEIHKKDAAFHKVLENIEHSTSTMIKIPLEIDQINQKIEANILKKNHADISVKKSKKLEKNNLFLFEEKTELDTILNKRKDKMEKYCSSIKTYSEEIKALRVQERDQIKIVELEISQIVNEESTGSNPFINGSNIPLYQRIIDIYLND